MSDDGPCGSELHEEWYVEQCDPLLARLLPAATQALHDEDRRLADAFSRAAPTDRLARRNQGLGYWLFETTLVYTVFKSWLPLAETEWESRYRSDDARTRKAADLVVHVDGIARYLFEAKWWMTTRIDEALREDIVKMRSWPDLAGRFLLTFWRSPRVPSTWRSDVEAVRWFCDANEISLAYVGAFHTDEAATRTTSGSGSYFALAVISV